MPQILVYALQVLNTLPSLIAAGQNVVGLIQHANAAIEKMQIEKRDPSPAEWGALNQTIAALRAELRA